MTPSLWVHNICCYVAIICLLTDLPGGESCSFPDFLINKKHEHWLYKTRLNEEKSGIKAYSLSATKSVITFAPDYPAENQNGFFEWKCVRQFNRDSFFIEVLDSQGSHFKCVDFVHLSSEVKRLKVSQDTSHNNDAICNEEKMWDPWLLVKGGSAPYETVQCSFIGGFNLQITDDNRGVCNKFDLMPRLEIGCHEEDKMYFDFQNCPHERFTPLMDRKQVLHCIGEWSDDTHKYIILRQPKRDHYWILRLPARVEDMNRFTAMLSSSITSELSNVEDATLQLTRKVVTNICMDAADDCAGININRNELCAGMYGAIYCKRTCKLCSPENEHDCTINRHSIGQWEFVSDDINKKALKHAKFSVTERKFKTKSLTNTICLKRESELDYHEYVFVKYQTNGCYPRFTCVTSHVVKRVMYFKESRGATWPQYEEDYYCSARTYDFQPPEPTWRVAVKERSDLSPVLCNIPMDLYDFQTQLDDVSCQGRLQTSSCTALSSTGFSVMFNQSDSCDLVDVHFDCILSKIYEEPGFKKVAILARDEDNIYYCFIFDIRFTTVTRIPANECHGEFIFWDHTELQQFTLVPSDGVCIERKTVAHSSATLTQTTRPVVIFLLTVLYLCMSS